MKNDKKILISFEELKEIEYNIEYNPFDTTGIGYLEKDFTEYLISLNEEAIEYYYKQESYINPKDL